MFSFAVLLAYGIYWLFTYSREGSVQTEGNRRGS
jgi:hypothetical protein